MAFKYTEEKLGSLDKETIIRLFLSQQEHGLFPSERVKIPLGSPSSPKNSRFIFEPPVLRLILKPRPANASSFDEL